jgi:serine/threonine protein kinase
MISLAKVIEKRSASNNYFTLYEKVCIIRQLLIIKTELGKKKINHRDYKLENILLESESTDVKCDYTLKLTDFDISSESSNLSEATFKRKFTTQKAQVSATPLWTSSEIYLIANGYNKLTFNSA